MRLASDEGALVEEFDLQTPRITFANVGGMVDVKKKLELSVLGPLRNPELYQAFGKTATGGLLLYGPPGCGKTYLARALAGEMGARFASIGLEDVLNMYFGESEQRLHKIFDTARRLAPMVLFFDEIDALGHKRSELRGGAGRNLVNQLLSEMDGSQHDNTNVFILGATNHPWDIDSALRRPGRFDRTVLVLPPDEPARESIIGHHLAGCPHKDIDPAALAKSTALFSGADLAQLCNLARESAIESSAAAGAIRPVGPDDFKRALRSLRPSTVEWFGQARNFALFANESGVYDDLLDYMKRNKLG
ncbi:MAG: ATP-binding protein [Betaproteobacteria bacterium]|nr:ATP-binding protein [Betaproteobacteria bacterium]